MKRLLQHSPTGFLLRTSAYILAGFMSIACVQMEAARAQYALSTQPQEYEPLEMPQVLPMPWADTVNPYTYLDLHGAKFTLFGEEFAIDAIHPIGISKWGNVEIMNDKSVVIIDAFHTSIMDSVRPTTQVSVAMDGMMGERIFKIQWKDMGFAGLTTDLFVNFQMWLHEKDGKVEFRYGPHSLECDMTDPTLQGAYVGMMIAPPDFKKISKLFWVIGDPANPKVSKLSIKAMHCPFEPNMAVAIATPTAGVEMNEEQPILAGIIANRDGTIELSNASSLKLYSITGQLIRSAERAASAMTLTGLASGRYFIEYVCDGETVRRAVAIE